MTQRGWGGNYLFRQVHSPEVRVRGGLHEECRLERATLFKGDSVWIRWTHLHSPYFQAYLLKGTALKQGAVGTRADTGSLGSVAPGMFRGWQPHMTICAARILPDMKTVTTTRVFALRLGDYLEVFILFISWASSWRHTNRQMKQGPKQSQITVSSQDISASYLPLT